MTVITLPKIAKCFEKHRYEVTFACPSPPNFLKRVLINSIISQDDDRKKGLLFLHYKR